MFDVMDTYISIKEMKSKRLTNQDIEFLHTTLNEMGINHFFAEPIADKEYDLFGEEAYVDYVIFYDSKDMTDINLVMLMMYRHAGYSDEFISKGASKMAECINKRING